MSELRAGMMCLIIGCKYNPEDIGKVCRLIRLLEPDEVFIVPDGRRAIFENDTSAWMVSGDGITYWELPFSLVSSKHLMPLKGDTDFTQEEMLIDEEIVA